MRIDRPRLGRRVLTAAVLVAVACGGVAARHASAQMPARSAPAPSAPAPDAAAVEPTDGSPDGLIDLLKASPTPDANLIAVLEKYRSVTVLPAEAAAEMVPALAETTADSVTLLTVLRLLDADRGRDAIPVAVMAAIARRVDKDAADKDQAVPILQGILKARPVMGKIAWRGGGRLKTYGQVLAAYVDHCPKDNPALVQKLADMQLRQITAARFELDSDAAVARVLAIDADKLTVDEDHARLDYIKMDVYVRAKKPEQAAVWAKAVWDRPDSQYRALAWPVYFESLCLAGKTAEAGVVLDGVDAIEHNATELAACRQRLADTAATQPATP